MKRELSSTITEENFNEVWNYADAKFIELKKKKVIRIVILFIANILFFVNASAITFDALTYIPSNVMSQFLDTLEPIKIIHNMFGHMIHYPELHIIIQIMIYWGFLQGTIFLVSGIVAGIMWLVYRPSGQINQSNDKAIDSKTLLDSFKEIAIRGKNVAGVSSMLMVMLYIFELIAIVVAFIIFTDKNIHLLASDESFTSIVDLFFNTSGGNFVGVAIIMIYGLYALLNEQMSSFLTPFYKTKLSEDIQKEARRYYYECNQTIKEQFEEEERILKLAQEITDRRKKEEKELLEKINYKNPVFKYVKRGIWLIVLIIALVFVRNKWKSFDLENLLNAVNYEYTENGEVDSTNTR